MSDGQDRLKQGFQTVRQQFFPRWDRASRVRIRQVADLDGAHGRVYSETRTIRITHLPEGDEGTLLLIHEIAHAVGNSGHGKHEWNRQQWPLRKWAGLNWLDCCGRKSPVTKIRRSE